MGVIAVSQHLVAVLVTGLLAGGVSCSAVQGGLLTGLIIRQHAAPTRARPTRRGQFGDDLIPVGGFLAGKVVSHCLLGVLLGALGSVVQLSIGARTTLQIGAGLLIITLGLAQLGVPGVRGIVLEPPASWAKLVRSRARSTAALAPALLGLATVLIPCGVTLSVEALALTSGSALAGAATMTAFVLGTSPLFTVLGYAARKAVTVWRGRLAVLTGLVVLVLGFGTLNAGLELAGSPLAASRIAHAVGLVHPASETSTVSTVEGHQLVVITASTAYHPSTVQVRAGVPTTLVVRSENAQGCLRSFLIPSRNVQAILPAQGESRIELGTLRPGQLDYACGMGMYTGMIMIV